VQIVLIFWIFYNESNLYEGQFLNDRPHGRGVYTWSDGSRFSGVWFEGNGQGVFQAINGDRYEGDLVDNKFHGRGRYFSTTGLLLFHIRIIAV
jgi:hypothetical protein